MRPTAPRPALTPRRPRCTGEAPVTVWASGFGGQRTQDQNAATLRTTNNIFGGAIGLDRKVRPDWLLGAFIGGGSGRLSVDLNSQNVDTDYVFGGGYSRFEWASQFFDVTVQGGNATSKSRPAGAEQLARRRRRAPATTAGTSARKWPMATARHRQRLPADADGAARYVAGHLRRLQRDRLGADSVVGGRTLQNFEERAELDVSKTTTFFGGDHALKTTLHGGVIALQRVGDATINAVLIGQNLSFATPGKRSTRRRGGRRQLRLPHLEERRAVRRGRGHGDVRPEPHRHRQRRRARRVLARRAGRSRLVTGAFKIANLPFVPGKGGEARRGKFLQLVLSRRLPRHVADRLGGVDRSTFAQPVFAVEEFENLACLRRREFSDARRLLDPRGFSIRAAAGQRMQADPNQIEIRVSRTVSPAPPGRDIAG